MLRSLFSGVSGLRQHQTKMDVIGNNIANVNTYGFKGSRVTFQELYSQTLKTASSPTGTTGGTNPQQVGLGVKVSAIDVMTGVGGVQTTDRALDLAIDGEGYFIVQNGEENFYTRSGNFYLDPSGYLVNADGLFVQGFMFDEANIEDLPDDCETILYDPDFAENAAPWTDQEFGRIIIPDNFYNISIDKNGIISGLDENGTLTRIGAVGTACFVNPAGLTRVGNNLLSESNNSGSPIRVNPGVAGGGELAPSSLEMSNVDLSKEFTDMIITQRGFQANSRIITVSDSLLEELINLKR